MSPFDADHELRARRAMLFLVGQIIISFLISAGCIWIILAPTNQPTTNAASALLGVIVAAWLTRVAEANA